MSSRNFANVAWNILFIRTEIRKFIYTSKKVKSWLVQDFYKEEFSFAQNTADTFLYTKKTHKVLTERKTGGWQAETLDGSLEHKPADEDVYYSFWLMSTPLLALITGWVQVRKLATTRAYGLWGPALRGSAWSKLIVNRNDQHFILKLQFNSDWQGAKEIRKFKQPKKLIFDFLPYQFFEKHPYCSIQAVHFL